MIRTPRRWPHLLGTIVFLAAITACEGPMGPEGPAGPSGPTGTSVAAVVTTVFSEDNVNASFAPVTLQTASITVPGPGRIIVQATADAYCITCPNASLFGFFKITNNPNDPMTSGPWTFFQLRASETESISRSRVYPVTTAGTSTFYLRGATNSVQDTLGYWRREMILIFLPTP